MFDESLNGSGKHIMLMTPMDHSSLLACSCLTEYWLVVFLLSVR